MRYLEKVIGEDEAGQMVKCALRPLSLGRRLRRRLVAAGNIRVNGRPAHLTNRLHTGDTLTVEGIVETTETVAPEKPESQVVIVFEDEHLAVVDKPAGMAVHPTRGHTFGTLASALLWHWQSRGETVRFRPVHRLDLDTSGLLLVAKDKLAHERLVRQLEQRNIRREYLAFAWGLPPEDRWTLDGPIGLPEGSRLRRWVIPEGKPAVTRAEVAVRYADSGACTLRLQLETGRTHQIRVHLAHAGHPVIGDWLYGSGPDPVGRQALHAFLLAFRHPATGEEKVFCSPLPGDLEALESFLRERDQTGRDSKGAPTPPGSHGGALQKPIL